MSDKSQSAQLLIGFPGSTSRTSPSVRPQVARVVAGMCPTISTISSVAVAAFDTASGSIVITNSH